MSSPVGKANKHMQFNSNTWVLAMPYVRHCPISRDTNGTLFLKGYMCKNKDTNRSESEYKYVQGTNRYDMGEEAGWR